MSLVIELMGVDNILALVMFALIAWGNLRVKLTETDIGAGPTWTLLTSSEGTMASFVMSQ